MRSWALRCEDVESSIPHTEHFAWATPNSKEGLSSTGDSFFECNFKDNESLLGISGLVMDSILTIGPVMQPLPMVKSIKDVSVSFWIDCLRCYLTWREMGGLDIEHDTRWIEAQDDFMEMLWYVTNGINLEGDTYDEYRERFARFDKLVVDNFSFLLTKDSSRAPSKVRQFTDTSRAISVTARLILQFLCGDDFFEVAELAYAMVYPARRRMTKTERGCIGLVPQEAMPRDKVVLIAGSMAPFILRPTGSSIYRIVGDSYIHGIMDGEAWDEAQTTTMWLE
jgi:hypothetical protein